MRIKFIASFLDPSGYGEAARQALLALKDTDIKVTTEMHNFTDDRSDEDSAGAILAKKLLGKYKKYDKVLIQLTPEMMFQKMEPAKYNIGTMAWETKGLDPRWVWYINKLDELWITTPSFKKYFKEAGVKVPIKIVPHPVDTSKTDYKPLTIPKAKKYKFYSIFQWTKRKNPEDLIKTYWRTFTEKDNVSLILHTYRANFSAEEQAIIKKDIAKWKSEVKLKHYPQVLLHLEPLTHEQIMRLHSSCDCYVSAHYGEGWGLPLMEALLCGKPIISTRFGGVNEWLERAGFKAGLVDYKLIRVRGMEWIPWYSPKQFWAKIDTVALGLYMEEAYRHPEDWAWYGKRLQKWVKRNFSYKKVGAIERRALLSK